MEKNKVIWACRRGMLELDLFLLPFAKEFYQGMTTDEKKIFVNLLTEADDDLFHWLMGHQEPKAKYKEMIQKIQNVKRTLSISPKPKFTD